MLPCLPWWLVLGSLSSDGQEKSAEAIPPPEIELPTAVAAVSRESIATGEVSAATPPDASGPSLKGQGRRDRIEEAEDAEGALALWREYAVTGEGEIPPRARWLRPEPSLMPAMCTVSCLVA